MCIHKEQYLDAIVKAIIYSSLFRTLKDENWSSLGFIAKIGGPYSMYRKRERERGGGGGVREREREREGWGGERERERGGAREREREGGGGGRERGRGERGEVEGRVELNREKENSNCLRRLGDGFVKVGIGSCLSFLGFFQMMVSKIPVLCTCAERERGKRGHGCFCAMFAWTKGHTPEFFSFAVATHSNTLLVNFRLFVSVLS